MTGSFSAILNLFFLKEIFVNFLQFVLFVNREAEELASAVVALFLHYRIVSRIARHSPWLSCKSSEIQLQLRSHCNKFNCGRSSSLTPCTSRGQDSPINLDRGGVMLLCIHLFLYTFQLSTSAFSLTTATKLRAFSRK